PGWGRWLLRAVRAVPGRGPDADRRPGRTRHGRPAGARDQRAPCCVRGLHVLVDAWAGRRGAADGPLVAVGPVRFFDADPVGDHAWRGVAHRAPRGHDPDVRVPGGAVRPATGVAGRPAGWRRIP